MKKPYTLLAAAILFAAMPSCKKQGLPTYSASNSIMFKNYDLTSFSQFDSVSFTFAYADPAVTDSTIRLEVEVTGPPSSQDRPFVLSVAPSSTAKEGIDFEKLPEQFLVHAGKVFDTISIKLLRGPELKQQPADLILQLQANGSFHTDIKTAGVKDNGTPFSVLQFKINFSDILTAPVGWYYFWGKFSPKKMDIICSLGHFTPLFLNNGSADMPLNSVQFSAMQSNMVNLLSLYLQQQKLAGTPVYYEDGTLMAINDN